MEVIDIGLNDLEPISIDLGASNSGNSGKSVNFGSGIELLMNDKLKQQSSKMSVDLGELDKLEDELNELSGVNGSSTTDSNPNGYTNFFNFSKEPATNTYTSSNTNVNEPTDSNLGTATVDSIGKSKTWDGFSKINEIPVSGTNAGKMSDRDRRRKKREMIKKLEEFYEKGHIKNNSHFTMDSSYDEIEDEYENAMEDKRRRDSVKLQGWWLVSAVNTMEYLNAWANPFDLNLDGLGEQVSEDIDSYNEIFEELHNKYKGGKLSPELSLVLRLGFSAAMVNFTNKALSTATPGFNDVIRQSPELMKAFSNATVNAMAEKSPAFEFANNLMQDKKNNVSAPPAYQQQQQQQQQTPISQMQFTERPSNRPDIAASRAPMFRESGVDMNQSYQSVNEPARQIPIQRPSDNQMQPEQRPEMRGPQNTDIDNILAGLKLRNGESSGNIQPPTPIPQPSNPAISRPTTPVSMHLDDDSMISISSLKDIQNTNMPKRVNKRKTKSDKNTISLDI
jgi:hypothetical protein